jgi:Cation transporting ATPase, C-terminus
MAGNIAGHSVYQIFILCWVLFSPGTLPLMDPPLEFEPTKGSLNWTVFFNVFVMLQLFNEFNARRLPTPEKLKTSLSEWNIFQGVWTNPMFCFIMVATFTLQTILVEYGGVAVNVVPGGLTTNQWMFCIVTGAGSLVWQLIINGLAVLLGPTASFETQESDDIISSCRKLTPEGLDSVHRDEPRTSKWDKVRLGVRRDILYARVFNTSVRSGANLGKLVRCAEATRRSDDYYKMLTQQLQSNSNMNPQ